MELSDPSIKRKIGELYLKRVLEESDLDVIKETISEHKDYVNFYNNLINKYSSEIDKLIDNQNFDVEMSKNLKSLLKNET